MIVSRNQLDTKIITAFLYLPAYKETEPSHARSAPLVYHRLTIVSMECYCCVAGWWRRAVTAIRPAS